MLGEGGKSKKMQETEASSSRNGRVGGTEGRGRRTGRMLLTRVKKALQIRPDCDCPPRLK